MEGAGKWATRTSLSNSRQRSRVVSTIDSVPDCTTWRCTPGRQKVDELVRKALRHGWTLLFDEVHPYAGGPEHYAAYLTNADGFEIELVAVEG